MSTDDDEAFARMLQQQLLDEERMLMEQEQQRQQQQQSQQQHQARPFDSQEYLQNLQQHGFDSNKPPEENLDRAVRAAAPPSTYQLGGGGSSGRGGGGGLASQQQQQQQPNYVESDEELARRLQEMETMGIDSDHSATNQSQEEEDARLARLLAETGGSFKDLPASATALQSNSDLVAPQVAAPTPTPPPPSFKPPPPAPSPAATPTHTPSPPFSLKAPPPSSSPEVQQERSRELKPPPPQPQERSRELKPPPPTSQPTRAYPDPPRGPTRTASTGTTMTTMTNNTVPTSNITNPRNNPVVAPGPAVRKPYYPSPLDGGPSSSSTAMAGGDPNSILADGGAFLDLPSDPRKDRQKKKGGFMGKIFGRSGSGGNKATQQQSTNKPSAVRSAAASSAKYHGRTRGATAPTNNNMMLKPSPPSGGAPATTAAPKPPPPRQQQPRHSNEISDDSVVRFPIPPPVPRPADTIGAPKGPVPYSYSVSRDAPELPEVTVGKKPAALTLTRHAATCSVCGDSVAKPLTALDRKFHNDCFRCITCHTIIDPNTAFAFIESEGLKQPMHRKCYAEIFGIKCAVCKMSIPAGPDGKVSFVKHPFFDTEQMCPKHARSMTRRCTGCHRFEPENEPFADLNDVGRCVCMACCRSVVVDSQDAQPLWSLVVQFFEEKLNMPIWKDFREIPILIVGYNALNDQMNNTSNVHCGASQIMTRGLCLTEHESGRRFRMNRMKFDSDNQSFVACDAEARGFTFFQVPDANKVNPDASVTAILCLSGLPRDLAASVLAHEATHAWIKLHPRFDFEKPIPPQVEEGCAQLIAHLFLNEGLHPPAPLENNDGTGPSDEKLRQYFKFSIETDDHDIYGTGYRRAAKAYSHIGIEALMSHVVLYQDFPET